MRKIELERVGRGGGKRCGSVGVGGIRFVLNIATPGAHHSAIGFAVRDGSPVAPGVEAL